MKITYSNWQQIDLNNFRSILDGTVSDGSQLLDSFNEADITENDLTSYSNSSYRGNWQGYQFSVTGNHFTDSNPNIIISSFNISNSNESLKASGKLSMNYYSEVLTGYFSSISYVNNVTGVQYGFSGKYYSDNFTGAVSHTVAGYKFTYSGSFIVDEDGMPLSGTLTAFSFEDTTGHKISVSGVAISYATFVSVTGTTSTFSDLYNALSFSGKDTITGSSDDEILDGQAGADTLIGGLGNDTYLVDLLSNGKLQDKITEAKNAGTDTLVLRGDISLAKAATIKLVSNVENIDISLTNNSLLNLTGDNTNNTLTGNAANNVIEGGKGADTMIGGAGNDTYVLDNAGDIVTESLNGGTDLVNIKFTSGSYSLGENVENGLISHAKAFALTGNALNNSLTGGAGANTINGAEGGDILNGGKGNDSLNGGAGNDSLTGGAGADTFVFLLADIGSAGAPSVDVITDFSAKQKDVLDLRDLLPNASEGDLTSLLTFIDINTNGANTEIRLSSTGGFAQGNYDASIEDARITLTGVNLLAGTDESSLLQTLMTKNQLLID